MKITKKTKNKNNSDLKKRRSKNQTFQISILKKIPKIYYLNLTPDSFSDGGKFNKKNKGVSRTINLYKTGAVSRCWWKVTRPGSK